MSEIYGILLDPKRFAVHDGPGVRTTFFTKGCPLSCRWCHNPESINPEIELAYMAHKCINCGECDAQCSNSAHIIKGGEHVFDVARCKKCMNCVESCLGKALKIYGRRVSVAQALEIALEDIDFYNESGGGVTVSGGEPLMQSDFTLSFLAELKKHNIHTALDTSCFAAQSKVAAALEVTDLFLVDFKVFDTARHRLLTGQGNEVIKSNLEYLARNNADIEIRIPLVPGYNSDDENIRATAEYLSSLEIKQVKLLAYHDMARSKYQALNRVDTMPHCEMPTESMLEQALEILKSYSLDAVR